MTKYQAKADAQTIGSNILDTVKALGSFKGIAYTYLDKCGLSGSKADLWYPMQSYCDFFEMLAEKTGAKTLFVIGKNLGQNLPLLEGMASIEQVYEGFNQDFKKNYRNAPPDEGFKIINSAPASCQIVFTGPLPSDFIRGMLEGIGQQFSDIDYMSVQIDDTQPRIEAGSRSTTYQLKWR